MATISVDKIYSYEYASMRPTDNKNSIRVVAQNENGITICILPAIFNGDLLYAPLFETILIWTIFVLRRTFYIYIGISIAAGICAVHAV